VNVRANAHERFEHAAFEVTRLERLDLFGPRSASGSVALRGARVKGFCRVSDAAGCILKESNIDPETSGPAERHAPNQLLAVAARFPCWGCKPKPPKFPPSVNFPVFDAWQGSFEGRNPAADPNSAAGSFRFWAEVRKVGGRKTSEKSAHGNFGGLGLHPQSNRMRSEIRVRARGRGTKPNLDGPPDLGIGEQRNIMASSAIGTDNGSCGEPFPRAQRSCSKGSRRRRSRARTLR
jgi:hypothetical protein